MCTSARLLCSSLSSTTCGQYGFCRWDAGFCDAQVPKPGVPVTANPTLKKDCPFPLWSIALVIVWLVMMVVLVFVILVIRTSTQQAVKSVKQDVAEVKDVVGGGKQKLDDNFL